VLCLTYSEMLTEVLVRSQKGSCHKSRQAQRSRHIPRRDGSWKSLGRGVLGARGRRGPRTVPQDPPVRRAVRGKRVSRRGGQGQQGRMDQGQLLLTSRSVRTREQPSGSHLPLSNHTAYKKKCKSNSGGKGPSAFCRASTEKTNYPKPYQRFSKKRSDTLGWERYLSLTAKLTSTPATTGKTFARQRDSGDNAASFRLAKTLTFPLSGHRRVARGRSPKPTVGTQY